MNNTTEIRNRILNNLLEELHEEVHKRGNLFPRQVSRSFRENGVLMRMDIRISPVQAKPVGAVYAGGVQQ